MLAGPTGVGKSHLARTIAAVTNRPFVAVDAVRLGSSSYARSEDVFARLLQAAGDDADKAGNGIVLIEGIDQLAKPKQASRDAGLQALIVSMLSGLPVVPPQGRRTSTSGAIDRDVQTSKILFIFSGIFTGLKSTSLRSLVEFGFSEELAGRFTTWITLTPYDEGHLLEVLRHDSMSPLLEYRRLFEAQGVKLAFGDEALAAIAREAARRGTGVRGMQAVLRKMALDYAYRIASTPGIQEIRVTNEDVIA